MALRTSSTLLAAAALLHFGMHDSLAKNDHGKYKGYEKQYHREYRGSDKHDSWDKHDNDRDGRDWRRGRDDDRRYDHDHDRVRIQISQPNVIVVRERLQPYYYSKCPPGLRRKHNGCLPPGHAKNYYIGQPLPTYVEYWAVPRDVLVSLPPAPYGTRYIWVDRDILLISEASKLVLDAVVLLSAV